MPVSERKRVQVLLKRSERLRHEIERKRVSGQRIRELLNALYNGLDRLETEVRRNLVLKRIEAWEDTLIERLKKKSRTATPSNQEIREILDVLSRAMRYVMTEERAGFLRKEIEGWSTALYTLMAVENAQT